MSSSFFKRIPYRQEFPEASKDFDGYYYIVPRHRRYARNTPEAEPIRRFAKMHRITFDRAVEALQNRCRCHILDAVAEDRRKKNPTGRDQSRTVTVRVKTTNRWYAATRNDERLLVKESVTEENYRLLECDYRAFPLPVAISIHLSGGDGLSFVKTAPDEFCP